MVRPAREIELAEVADDDGRNGSGDGEPHGVGDGVPDATGSCACCKRNLPSPIESLMPPVVASTPALDSGTGLPT